MLLVPTLVAAGVAFGLSQVALSVLLLWHRSGWTQTERLYALLMLAISAYLLTPLLTHTPIAWLLGSLATAVPGLFWLLSISVFNEQVRIRAWQASLVAATVLLPLLGLVLRADGMLHWLLIGLPQLLEFALLGLTLWVVARHWRVDLVESRRSLRWWFMAVNGVYIFALILLRELLFANDADLSHWQYVSVGGLLLLTNSLLLQFKPAVLFAAPATLSSDAQNTSDVKLEQVDPELLDQLRSVMTKTAIYRQMGLTLGQLAAQLDIPQYRLRQAINGGLGYRNFNDFLNSYRIAEASRRLTDAAERGLPILTIAMDVGFRSLSSFNKAFKETQGVTPTAWRKAAIEENVVN